MLGARSTRPSRTVLQTTVRTAVDFLFGRLEKLHGPDIGVPRLRISYLRWGLSHLSLVLG
ncbi:hypothetical protein DPMN_106121 [Dreissena polymorpha]|uniref:Uncharacterized protein n=1 Tax=Dreissena polymorpha TaxID=45954 RepID=A0A9D4K4E3_DREPO|nr:hypothetical protein DPMN_106121 [Dreissena polymorpha]